MERELTKSEVEAELRDKSESMVRRIDDIEHEMTTTATSVRDWLRDHPLLSLGGVAVAGLLVGWLLRGRLRPDELSRAHEKLVQQYLDVLQEEVGAQVAQGMAPDEAVRTAMRDRIPLVVYTTEETDGRSGSGGSLRQGMAFFLKTTLGFLLRDFMDELSANLVRGASKGVADQQPKEAAT